MLTPGNLKLGKGLIWGFGLPSQLTCPGKSETCQEHCYSRRTEEFRPQTRSKYLRNLELSKRPDFPRRMVAHIIAHDIAVVRVHTAGDMYSAGYARKWLRVMRQLPWCRVYLISRSRRVEAILPVLVRMARRKNCRVWFSCDRDTGVPSRVPRRVRLAWLMTSEDDLPPRADLVFRIRRLRRTPAR